MIARLDPTWRGQLARSRVRARKAAQDVLQPEERVLAHLYFENDRFWACPISTQGAYLVLTNDRLLLFDIAPVTKSTRLGMDLPRETVAVAGVKRGRITDTVTFRQEGDDEAQVDVHRMFRADLAIISEELGLPT